MGGETLIAELRSGCAMELDEDESQSVIDSSQWACCDACGKWRRLRLGGLPNDGDEWVCFMNEVCAVPC